MSKRIRVVENKSGTKRIETKVCGSWKKSRSTGSKKGSFYYI
jgi:hypothetical protein